MSRKKKYKIFDLDYLANEELEEDDLYYLFETHSLNYSLIVNMFLFTNQELSDEKKILNLVKKDKEWMYKYFWTNEQRNNYQDLLTKIFKNIGYCSYTEAMSNAQWWITLYGLTNDALKDKKNIDKL